MPFVGVRPDERRPQGDAAGVGARKATLGGVTSGVSSTVGDSGGVADDARRGSTGLHRTGPSDRVGTATLRRWRRRLADERAEAEVYRDLATRRSGEEREILLGARRGRGAARRALGAAARRRRRRGRGAAAADLRLLAFLARRFGSVFVLALAQRAETRSPYRTDADATAAMAADERIHEEVVRGLAARGRAGVSGTFRAAVFGANDGLVSNLALVLGVSGGGASTATVLLTGLAGLLSGALSMGAGEYVSVRSQRELLAASTPDVADAHTVLPAPRRQRQRARAGLPGARACAPRRPTRARRRAAQRRPGPARSQPRDAPTDSRRHEVVGTGLGRRGVELRFFASGAAVPVLPFLFGLEGTAALVVAAVLVGLALLLTGATVGVLSGGPPLRRALRQLAIGAGAAASRTGSGWRWARTAAEGGRQGSPPPPRTSEPRLFPAPTAVRLHVRYEGAARRSGEGVARCRLASSPSASTRPPPQRQGDRPGRERTS